MIEEFFVEIGLTEDLSGSLVRIGHKLGKPVEDLVLPRVNVSKRVEEVPEALRQIFREKWPLEHDIYDYVRRQFAAPDAVR